MTAPGDASRRRPRLSRPSGDAPPDRMTLPCGASCPLRPLAAAITDRFLAAFPDELGRYDDVDAVRAWCEHDNRHLLGWAALDARGYASLVDQVCWLGRVLEARGYPLGRLAADLAIAADVVEEHLGEPGAAVAEALRRARGAPIFDH